MRDIVIKILLEQKQTRKNVKVDYVFTKNNIQVNIDYVSKRFKKAVKNIDENSTIHLHSLRHSFASNLINEKNVELIIVKDLLGHSRISTTEIYSHLKVKSLIEAVRG